MKTFGMKIALLVALAFGIASAAPAAALQIPALATLSKAVIQAWPASVAKRADLMKARDTLRGNFATNEAKCSNVDERDTDTVAFCKKDGKDLSDALTLHIKDSNAFNDAVARIGACRDTLIQYEGKCQFRVAVEEKLQTRILAAVRGIKSTSEAISSERSGLVLTKVSDHFKNIGIAAGVLVVRKKPDALVTEALALSADLAAALVEWKTCSAPSLQVSCSNLKDFQRILRETAQELFRVQKL